MFSNLDSKRSKLTLIVDGNWLLMSRLSILASKYDDEHILMKNVKDLMVKSMNIVLKTFPKIDNIIFVADNGSWRTKIDVPNFIKNANGETVSYKGNRVKSDTLDWDIIFEEYEDLMSNMSDNGILVFREHLLEGDDACWYWSNRLNRENTNCMIWSKDKDLTQLVSKNNDGFFTVCWNKDSGLTMVEEDENDETNFLMNAYCSDNDTMLNDIMAKSSKICKIDPNVIVVDKIVRGDSGDNIMPIILKESKSNPNKKFRVAVKDLPKKLDVSSDVEISEYVDYILNHKLYKGKVIEDRDQIIEHFKYNRTLVRLDESSYPESIKNLFAHYDAVKIRPNKDLSSIESKTLASKNDLTDILENI